jgi:CDP-glycerol glycerophosphotransferase (TagB/SpsB family)
VLIDKASPYSSDMTYLRSSDIYLGDVSSQVYEFLETPRPCVFLDGHDTYWQNDLSYLHWTLGPVIRDVADLPGALREAHAAAPHYAKLQTAAFADTFEISAEEAGLRGARIIADFLDSGRVDPKWQLV